MSRNTTRRDFLLTAACAPIAVSALSGCASPASTGPTAPPAPYTLSLAQWSLHRRFFGAEDYYAAIGDRTYQEFGRLLREEPSAVLKGADPLDFAHIARTEFGIDAIEYVNQFILGRARDTSYLGELKQRAADEGVTSVLIMCDQEGNLGDPDPVARAAAINNHHKWADAAAFLGCHSIRVNARSTGSYDEQAQLAADGLARLADYADGQGVNVLVENHGGLSSNGAWLAGVITLADHPRLGTLPDFGNFNITSEERYDPYRGVEELMPLAKAVSAKCYDFDADGNETTLDFPRLMRIVLAAGYHGRVGIEYEGSRMSEHDGIVACKALLERIAAEVAA